MKKIQDLVQIHFVTNAVPCEKCGNTTNEKRTFREGMCDAHTHGLKDFGFKELQIVLLTNPHLLGYILNTVAKKILSKEIIPSDKLMVEGIFEDCPVRLDSAIDSEKNPVWRVIIPDDEGFFPEETANDIYARQTESPYCNNLS